MSVMDLGIIGMPFDMAMSNEMSRRQFYSRAQMILGERDALTDRAAYWKQRAKSAEGHLFANDVRAAAKALHANTTQNKTPFEELSEEDRHRRFRGAWTVVAAINAERNRRKPKDSPAGEVWCGCGDGPSDGFVCPNCLAADGWASGSDVEGLRQENRWLKKVIESYAEQMSPLEPIPDEPGWSRRVPGYDLPSLVRNDARYRWLRDECGIVEYRALTRSPNAGGVLPSGDTLDEAIDAARSSRGQDNG